jgi:hypothetical protein
VDPVGSGWGPVAGSCECSDEPAGSGATDLVSQNLVFYFVKQGWTVNKHYDFGPYPQLLVCIQ